MKSRRKKMKTVKVHNDKAAALADKTPLNFLTELSSFYYSLYP